MAKRGDSFQRNGYVPLLGDVVHLNWSPVVGHEMDGPHYGLVVSADLFNQAAGDGGYRSNYLERRETQWF
jgi:mRNA interferase MazF